MTSLSAIDEWAAECSRIGIPPEDADAARAAFEGAGGEFEITPAFLAILVLGQTEAGRTDDPWEQLRVLARVVTAAGRLTKPSDDEVRL